MSKSIKITPEFVKQFIYSTMLNKLPNHIQLISTTDESASNSNVYIYNKDNNKYIIKNTYCNERIAHVITEYKIYNYLNILRYLNVCDTIIINYDSALYQNSSIKQTNFLMFNETASNDYTIKSLYNLLDDINNITDIDIVNVYLNKIIPALLFQLTYTLECLVRAKVKHNDLHLYNILVFIHNDNNIISNPDNFSDDKLKYDKYIVTPRSESNYFGPLNMKNIYDEHRKEKNINQETKTYYVPNYGFKIKIFDFDWSCSYNINNEPIINNTELYINSFTSSTFKYSNITSINNIPNEYIDLLYLYIKIFEQIYNIKLHTLNNNILYYNIFYYIFIKFIHDGDDDKYINPIDVNSITLTDVYNLMRHIFNDTSLDITIINYLIEYYKNHMLSLLINKQTNEIMYTSYLNVNKYDKAYKYIPSIYEILSVIFTNDNYINYTYKRDNINNKFNIANINTILWKDNHDIFFNNILHKLYILLTNKTISGRIVARKRIKFELKKQTKNGYLVDKVINYMHPLIVKDNINSNEISRIAKTIPNLKYNNDNNTVNLYPNNNENTNNMSFSNKIIFINL